METTQINSFQDAGANSFETTQPKLALIPLRSAATSKIAKQQQRPLEAKQFPIVLGRTNLSQWWYESCDCQQYYCRLHCRPVAKNIGSLSKVMIQIDTQGNAHIVGKNPHLVTITSPERNHGEKSKSEAQEEHPTPVVLCKGDILSIGRRDREPWMRFQVVENPTGTTFLTNSKKKHNRVTKTMQAKSNELESESLKQSPEQPHENAQALQEAQNFARTNLRHDARLPEWITTTTTTDTKEAQRHQAMVATLTKAAAAAGAAADADERINNNSGNNKSRKNYRYNSYYNYYNQNNSGSNCEIDPTQRKRRRTTSTFHPGLAGNNIGSNINNIINSSNKGTIRSAEDLFHNGYRKSERLFHNNDPQIHLVFQDFETSAQLIRAGTKQARNQRLDSSNAKKRKHARTDRNFIGKPEI